ncbi:uncharacterized protein PHACADRAFT_258559 [Phanerochaete carnosa HHB-10118-sp]|uniref:U2A'/phosphoprotein 32 family A C-terminal domain-containing protein n=1 Tax=Phanerochaete carnosa (strain HHB-10118-sp) TaxID=650164 RepID=K5W5Z7_PHACS|nr:uncharacterized protein PHACADRAFT_258559 [Phanerochaete carnosa HHB-10118-sp]EKM54595.1 hypothetical protein PHACADRAFT_258559 [Phanerochaete carnosa HHB-10118-sp]
MSLASTFSAVSKLSLGGSWWGKSAPPTVDGELKFIYSRFTVLPALRLHAPEPKLIAEMANEQLDRALCLDAFKMLQILELEDVDPRIILGWDRLAVSLRSLSIRRSGLEDIGDVLIGSVADDQARREGRAVVTKAKRPRVPPSRQGSFRATRLPASVPEDSEDENEVVTTPKVEEPDPIADEVPRAPEPQLPPLMWSSLRHLCLAENALTFIPTAPLEHLTSVTHLDLSSNLLVSVPPGLSALYNLVSLNLSDNMIDSVLGIYTMLGQVLSLILLRNRLESICGLERLKALERADLRHNLIEESAEIGRLAALPNIAEVWVEGNPLTEIEEGYRIRCFDLFWKEGRSILLDGTPPSFYEKRYLTERPSEQMTSTRTPAATINSPPIVAVNAHVPHIRPITSPPPGSPGMSPTTSASASQTASPQLAALAGRGRRKKTKRIVDLDGGSEANSSRSTSHARMGSDALPRHATSPPKASAKLPQTDSEPVSQPGPSAFKATAQSRSTGDSEPAGLSSGPVPPPKFVSRHARRQSEFAPASPLATSPPSESSSLVDRRGLAHKRSATMTSRSAARCARVSATTFEPPPGEEKNNGQMSEAEAFRARIEALRSDMGDGWLKVFNQSHMASPTSSPPVASG